MSKRVDGGPAFPTMSQHLLGDHIEIVDPGMSLRDWFASQVISACGNALPTPELAARRSYEIADAMLAERAKAVQL